MTRDLTRRIPAAVCLDPLKRRRINVRIRPHPERHLRGQSHFLWMLLEALEQTFVSRCELDPIKGKMKQIMVITIQVK